MRPYPDFRIQWMRPQGSRQTRLQVKSFKAKEEAKCRRRERILAQGSGDMMLYLSWILTGVSLAKGNTGQTEGGFAKCKRTQARLYVPAYAPNGIAKALCILEGAVGPID